jgi:trk system potassium uptake protein TrkA
MARSPEREFAVIGLGRFGSNLALTLEHHGRHVLGTDADPEVVQRLSDRLTRVVALDSTDERSLTAAGIPAFDTVVVALGADFAQTVMTTVALKRLDVRRVLCRATTLREEEILLQLGADRVIRPEYDAGKRLAEQLIAPSLVDQLKWGPECSIADVHTPSSLAGKTIGGSRLRNRYGITVLLLKQDHKVTVSPGPRAKLHDDDVLVVFGTKDKILQFSQVP